MNCFETTISRKVGGDINPEKIPGRCVSRLSPESDREVRSPAIDPFRVVAATGIQVRWAPETLWAKPLVLARD
jgi:hypothetical protein